MKKYKTAIIVILVFVIQTVIHYLIASNTGLATEQFLQIYGFLFLITLIVILIVEFADANFPRQLGFVFLAIILFKIMSALLFVSMTDMNVAPQKYNFLIAYLILVIVFTIYVAQKLLNTDKKH